MSKSHPETIESLEQKISVGRKKLQEAYDARGYTDSVGISDAEFSSASIKLDKLINRYHRLNRI